MRTAAERFSTWAKELSIEQVPKPVVEAAKLHALDAIGCGLAAQALGEATAAREVARATGGKPESSALGCPDRLPAPSAAFANGMLCHGLDFDDTHPEAVCHVSAVVVPAAMAAAEAANVGGDELLVALIAANEIVARIGMAAPAGFHRRGFHPTSVCGVFGATAAAGRIAGLSADRIAQAFGISGSLASGIFEYLADGSQTKPIHAGWAAQAGILAARLAAHGATGPASVLEGRYGLFAAFADLHEMRLDAQTQDLGERWETPRISFKPYPACHFVHASIDAAVAALAGRTISPDEIREIVVAIPEPEIPIVLEPLDQKAAPRTAYEAKFSLPFSVAARLVHGRLGVESYEAAAIADSAVLGLARKVRYELREFPTYPSEYPGAARIVLRDGTALEAEAPFPRGGTKNPMTDEEVRAKYRSNASLALEGRDVAALEESILTLEEARDLEPVLAPLRAARQRSR